MSISALIIDDEQLAREELKYLLDSVGGVDVVALRADLVTCRERLNEIADDYEEDRITRSQFLTRTDKRRAKMAAIEPSLPRQPRCPRSRR